MPSPGAEDPRRVLERVRRDSEVLGGGSSLVRGAPGAAQERDPAEIWGRRVGRALSVLLAVGLTWWLGVQLGWWSPP